MRTSSLPADILVRGPNWIGDLVMAGAFFRGLRELFPQSRIVLACPQETVGIVQAEWCAETIALRRDHRKLPLAVAFWAGEIRRRGFDCGISLPASVSSGFLLRCAGIPVRVGFAERGAGFFFSRSMAWVGRGALKHKSQLYLDLLSLLGGQGNVKEFAKESSPASEHPNTIVLAPGASIALREWPGFVDLAVALRQQFPDCSIRVVGTSEQGHWEKKFAEQPLAGVHSCIGRTSLPELMQLCREARFVVANDSGVAHIAASLAGAPTVVLFGPGDPAYIAPLGHQVRIARASGVLCSPCEKPRCAAPFGYQACLKALRVEDVLRCIATLN